MFIMNKRSRETEGLTLIELLITIAVIAIVAAISVPVISNVVGSARTNAAASMQEQVNTFIDKYLDSGQVTYDDDGTHTFAGFVDLDGNGDYAGTNERIEELVVGSEFTVGGVTAGVLTGSTATVTSASGSATAITTYTLTFDPGNNSNDTTSQSASLAAGDTIELTGNMFDDPPGSGPRYVFSGWSNTAPPLYYDDPTDEGFYSAESKAAGEVDYYSGVDYEMGTSDTTLYAIYETASEKVHVQDSGS
jgi:prepilin-type N-terminal cleavage/methylation domain-containing protein